MAEKVKLLPSGISDFKQLRRQNRYYVDKSMYIPTIEEVSNFLFLIRPRRFGKSLFLTMLAAYYDLNGQEEFPKLFGGLWIAEHPTEQKGQYQVLHLDFSRVSGKLEYLKDNFYSYLGVSLDSFARQYEHCYPKHLTQLHLIVVQLRVYDIERMEEIVSPIVAGRPIF